MKRVHKSDEHWRETLTAEQYRVLRRQGTERAFTGAYWATKSPGIYCCAGCDLELFAAEAKFDSGTGWPSFTQPVAGQHVEPVVDPSGGLERIEVRCARCGGHLGHRFDDGPLPTGQRFCINSASLRLAPTASTPGG